VASLLMLLVAVALLAAIATMHFAIHGAEVQVPSLKGMTVADARSVTAGLGLNLNVDNRYYSAMWPRGIFLRSRLRRERWCGGSGRYAWPRAWDRKWSTCPIRWGSSSACAELQLRRAGLEVGATVRLPYATVAAGTVLAQDPPAHAQDIAQPSVNLLVAAPDDEAPDGYVMPDLVGLPVVSAQSALAKVGIKSATPNYVDVPVAPHGQRKRAASAAGEAGRGDSATPLPGARVDQSTRVRLTVAK
jgi:beta-lactam-binding protein with PASTA domain